MDVSKAEMNNDEDEQEVLGNDQDGNDEPPSKKARKMNNKDAISDNSIYNERFGVRILKNKKEHFVLLFFLF